MVSVVVSVVSGASSAKTSGSLARTCTAWGAAINVKSPMLTDTSAWTVDEPLGTDNGCPVVKCDEY